MNEQINTESERSRTFPYVLINIPAEFKDRVEAFIWEQDILGLEDLSEFDDSAIFKVYFNDMSVLEECCRLLAVEIPELRPTASGTVNYDDWVSFLHGGFEPLEVGGFIVVPAENGPEIPAGLSPVYIIPGRGFGTGSHATTRMTLRFLVEQMKPGWNVLDVGTGSGILAIVAAQMGAAHIDAVDIDDESLENAHDNLELNGVADKVTLAHGSFQALDGGPYDLVLANIIAPTLVKLFHEGLVDRMKPGGLVVLSGIPLEAIELIETNVAQFGLEEVKWRRDDRWTTLLARKR